MVNAVCNRPWQSVTFSTRAERQLGDPQSSGDRPGTIFRIRPDRRREVVMRVPVGLRKDDAPRGSLRLRSDVEALSRCLGLPEMPVKRGGPRAPVTVTLEPIAFESADDELEGAVCGAVDDLDLDGPDRYFVVRGCHLASQLSAALPQADGDALALGATRFDKITVIPAGRDIVQLRFGLDRPERLAFSVAEIRRTRTGVTLTPVTEVLSWSSDQPSGLARVASEIKGEWLKPGGPAPTANGTGSEARVADATPKGAWSFGMPGAESLVVPLPTAERVRPSGHGMPGAESLIVPLPTAERVRASETAGSPAATEEALVHWNTRLRDGDRTVKTLAVGRASVLETWLGPEGDPGALLDSSIPADLVPDGTAVTFVIVCSAPVLRPPGGGAPTARYTAVVTVAAGATPPVKVEVVPDRAGELTLELSLYTGGALRVRSRLAVAVASTAEPAAAGVAQASGSAVALRALVGPAAAVRLEINGAGQLEVDVAPFHWGPGSTWKGLDPLALAAICARSQLVELSDAYRAGPAADGPFALADGAATMLAFAKIGAELHKAFFGRPHDASVDDKLRQIGELIATCPGGRMQIVAGSLPFPWAVMYDGLYRDPHQTLETAADVDPSRFWGARFQIDRAVEAHLDGTWPPRLGDPVRAQLCLNTHLDPAVVAAEQQIFDRSRVTKLPAIDSNAGLCAFFRHPPDAVDLLYLFCHANAAETVNAASFRPYVKPEVQAYLMLDASGAPPGPLQVGQLRDISCEPIPGRPLVVFNACGSAAGDRAYQSEFLTLFVDTYRARGFIGTDWTVNAGFADAFGRRLIQRLLDDHLPVAEALAAVGREALAAGNPFAFIYALYARPDLTLLPGAAS
jgi:hypothetical protein